jgi:hypothetical protein
MSILVFIACSCDSNRCFFSLDGWQVSSFRKFDTISSATASNNGGAMRKTNKNKAQTVVKRTN